MKRSTFFKVLFVLFIATPTAVNWYKHLTHGRPSPSAHPAVAFKANEHLDMSTRTLLETMHGLGVTFAVADDCPNAVMGVYDAIDNEIMLCRNNIDAATDPKAMLTETIEHEAVHVAQDLADGMANETYAPLGLDTSKISQAKSDHVIMFYPRDVRTLEMEAHYLEGKPGIINAILNHLSK